MDSWKLIRVCGMVILKWMLKKLVLYLDLINTYNTEQSEGFRNVNVDIS